MGGEAPRKTDELGARVSPPRRRRRPSTRDRIRQSPAAHRRREVHLREADARRISLHAGDLVHNTRTALDHVLARLKDHFGGGSRSGTFPITESDADWKGRIYPRRDGKRQRGPLDGLPCSARLQIYREQPHVAYGDRRRGDPIAILSALDNTDKHRLLHHGFVYPAAERGLDLIQVRDRKKVLSEGNVWVSGQPITHGTVMARFRVRGLAKDLLRVDPNAEIKLSTGPLDAPRTTYEDMIVRVRGIADRAGALIDGQP